ncbi:MAG: NAD-dependent epimerase/dehydratase family protein [Candidatus Pacebacteria bacterium]|nr:NAD-dependent epimerase/dehydratase family protein [Candidatus Paceibacterota bacterium]
MAKCVVTGGLGFIGHHLVKALIERGDEVMIIDNQSGLKNLSPETIEARFVGKAEYVNRDISDPGEQLDIKLCCEGADYFFHLAALPRVQYSFEYPVETALANVIGTVMMLNAAHMVGAKRFVFASSSSVYGDSDELPLHEDLPLDPMSPYALHKKQGEEWCKHFSLLYGLPTVCLRFFNVYGPGADSNGAYALVIAKFLEQKRKGEPLTITGDGTQTRDFTHVSDVVRALLLAAETAEVCDGGAINIGGGRMVSVNEVAKLIGGNTVNIPPRLEPHDTLASIGKAKGCLGWEPRIVLEDGIRQLLVSNQFS